MTEPTIIALVIIVGVFLVIAIAQISAGHEAALKLWNGMSTLTGVAFGAIITYYFADQSYKEQITYLENENKVVRAVLATASDNATEARESITPFVATLEGSDGISAAFPVAAAYINKLPKKERLELIGIFTANTEKLKAIEVLTGNINLQYTDNPN